MPRLLLLLASTSLATAPAAARGKAAKLAEVRCEAVLRNAQSWAGAPAPEARSVEACLLWYSESASEEEQQAMTCMAEVWGRPAWDACMVTFLPSEQAPGFRLELGGSASKAVAADDAPIIQGSLDKAQIEVVIGRSLGEIRACYQRELTASPALSGRVVVKFVITSDGTVSSATTEGSTLESPTVEGCIAQAFMGLEFPEPPGGGVVIVSYPFQFSPG